jgi:hypothetical protein
MIRIKDLENLSQNEIQELVQRTLLSIASARSKKRTLTFELKEPNKTEEDFKNSMFICELNELIQELIEVLIH